MTPLERYQRAQKRRMGSLAQMNANRRARQNQPGIARDERPARPPPVADEARRAEAEAARRRAKEAEEAARAARVREEERRALLARLAKIPAADRQRFLEEERIVAEARASAARLRRQPQPTEDRAPADLESLFGIQLDDSK